MSNKSELIYFKRGNIKISNNLQASEDGSVIAFISCVDRKQNNNIHVCNMDKDLATRETIIPMDLEHDSFYFSSKIVLSLNGKVLLAPIFHKKDNSSKVLIYHYSDSKNWELKEVISKPYLIMGHEIACNYDGSILFILSITNDNTNDVVSDLINVLYIHDRKNNQIQTIFINDIISVFNLTSSYLGDQLLLSCLRTKEGKIIGELRRYVKVESGYDCINSERIVGCIEEVLNSQPIINKNTNTIAITQTVNINKQFEKQFICIYKILNNELIPLDLKIENLPSEQIKSKILSYDGVEITIAQTSEINDLNTNKVNIYIQTNIHIPYKYRSFVNTFKLMENYHCFFTYDAKKIICFNDKLIDILTLENT